LLWGAGVKSFLILVCAFFVQVSVASVPEPSFIIYGQVLSSGTQVTQDGMIVSARYGGNHLAETTLTSANSHEFVLEIPLEANIGNRDIYKARVGDVINLQIAGESVSDVQISDRGVSVERNLLLPNSFDSDGDGINDALEIADGKNPNDPNDPVKFGNLDLDGDGISNGAEFFMGTYDPFADYDDDGYANQDEYTLASNPNNADDFPKQMPDAGQYSALHAHSSVITFLQNETGSNLTWNEAVHGKPTSLLSMYWNIDLYLDLLVATDQGKVLLLQGNADGQYTSPSLLNLSSLPVGGAVRLGFNNIDGINSKELWVFSHVSNKLYAYKRNPVGQPYGDNLWFDVALPNIDGDVVMGDLNNDGAMDLLASGVDVSAVTAVTNTLVQFNGSWDGYTLGFNAPVQLVQESYLNNSPIQILPNIGEVGFDKKQDIIIKGNDQKLSLNLSFNGYGQAALDKNLAQKLVTQETASPAASLFNQGIQLDTESGITPFLMADHDTNGTADALMYMGISTSNAYQFRLVNGVINTKETDGDGILDYKDLNAIDANIPLINGNKDFDLDGIVYGIDGNHSGLEDGDSDGMSDAFELQNGLNPADATDAATDLDGDGRSNYEEFQDGTNPQAKTSVTTQDARLITSVRAFDTGASDIQLMNDELIVVSQTSPSVKLYNLDNLSQMRTLQVDDANGVSKVLSSGNLLITGNMGGHVEIWDADSARRLAKFEKNASSVTDMSIDGTALYVLHADGVFYQYNIQTLAYVGNWKIYDGFLTSLLARNNILYIQASNPEKIMFVWDTTKKEVIYNITGNAECCEKVVAELSGETLILANSYSGNGIFATNIGNLNSQQVVSNIDISAVRSVNGAIYVGRKSGVIERYSSTDGSFKGRVAAPYSQVREIELINGGFLSLHADGNVYFWDHK
jgi:hypothetical protein